VHELRHTFVYLEIMLGASVLCWGKSRILLSNICSIFLSIRKMVHQLEKNIGVLLTIVWTRYCSKRAIMDRWGVQW